MSSPAPNLNIENQLLRALPESEYQELKPHLELVTLQRGQILYDANQTIEYVYFPSQALISLIALMENGALVEVGVIGSEGIVGLPVCWGGDSTVYQTMVQIPGTAMRLKAVQLKTQFLRGGTLNRLLLRYMQALFTHSAQSAACNRIHTIEERLARWLLTVQDRIKSDDLPLTQEFLSHMLGARRSGVTVAASTLSQAGMIRYSRGKITILNSEALASTACECYQIIKDEYNRLLDTNGN